MNYARALLDGGFADLHKPAHWNLGFVRSVTHRAEYESLYLEPAKAFVEAMAPGLAKLAKGLRAEPRVNGSIMRIHRDTRFSKDKKPYKTGLFLLLTDLDLGLGLFAATAWLWLRYGYASPHLDLLSHYLPGYRSGIVGGAIGGFWLFLYAAAAAGSTAWIYNRVVRRRFRG